MIIKGRNLRKDILRDGMAIDEIIVNDDKIKFNDHGYAIVRGNMFRFRNNTNKILNGNNVKGIIDKDGNEVFPFKSYYDDTDEIPGLMLIGNNVISKEEVDNNNNPIYNHIQIKDGFSDVTYENKIPHSLLRCNHYKMLNNHTLLATIIYNLNKNSNFPIYYKKYFLYSLLYGGSVVSEYFNDIKPLRYDNHSSILKAHAYFYALEPTENDWIHFYNGNNYVEGEYQVKCGIDDRGNSLPPFSTMVGEKYFSFEPTEDEKRKYIEIEAVKQQLLNQIVKEEFDKNKTSLSNLQTIEMEKYSYAALKELLKIISSSESLTISNTMCFSNKEMIEKELQRRCTLIKKTHPNIKSS